MSKRISRQEAVKGLVVNHVTKGEVLLLETATGPVVRVEAWDWRGEPVAVAVKVADLRWS